MKCKNPDDQNIWHNYTVKIHNISESYVYHCVQIAFFNIKDHLRKIM